jgi:UDP-2-acetamido-3-amino-2,3-dideoxy-glucuronate N-acetyltransferase
MSNRRLALIGAGYWGKNLARNFHATGALHTLCDLSPQILGSYGADYADIRKTSDIASVLSDPTISQVAIAAPAVHHHKLAKAALLAGKDVFVEKPLCLSAGDAEELIALAKANGRILMVGHLLQYHPYVRVLQEMVRNGEFGVLHYLTSNRLNLGKIRQEENALWSFAPHDLSVVLSLAGDHLPERVQCMGGSFLTPGVADTTLTTLAFAGNLKAQVHVSWLNPFKEQKLTVVGSSAMAVFDDTKPWHEKLAVYRNPVTWDTAGRPQPNKVAPEYVVVPEAEPLREECRHFLDCSAQRSAPRSDGAEGLRVLRVLQAAQASLEQDGVAQSIRL